MQTLNTSYKPYKKEKPSTIENTLPTNIKTHHHPSHPTHFVISCRLFPQTIIHLLSTTPERDSLSGVQVSLHKTIASTIPVSCPLAFVSIARTPPSHSSSCVHSLSHLRDYAISE